MNAAGADAAPTPGAVPVIVVDGRGFGHGVGMAQDGALAMGVAGASTNDILQQFYPGTTIGKATGHVRVPVFTGNGVELRFPEGGEVRGTPASSNPSGTSFPVRVAPGGAVLVYRDGEATRVKTVSAPTTASTTSSTSTSTTSTTAAVLLPFPSSRNDANRPGVTPSTTTSTTAPASEAASASAAPLFTGPVVAAPSGDGRVGGAPRAASTAG